MKVYTNARGEFVVSFDVFSQLSVDAVMSALLPAKRHTRRCDRRSRS